MRHCMRCCFTKPPEEFYTHKTRGFQAVCKACQAEDKKLWYQKNRSAVIQRARERKDANKIRLAEYLAAHPCVDCGEADTVVLDFDHLRAKRRSISALVHSTTSWERIGLEIEKCEVRCANCHRRRTARQFQWKWRPARPSTAGLVYILVLRRYPPNLPATAA